MWEQDKFLHKTHIKTAWERELFYSIMYPPNMTVKWLDTDKPESATYKKDIKYTFNEYGFRSDSFNDRGEINILTCGCSHTVGVGVDQHEAWPFVLKAMLEEKTGKKVVVWNLATSGASPDYVLRSVYKTLQTLKHSKQSLQTVTQSLQTITPNNHVKSPLQPSASCRVWWSRLLG